MSFKQTMLLQADVQKLSRKNIKSSRVCDEFQKLEILHLLAKYYRNHMTIILITTGIFLFHGDEILL